METEQFLKPRLVGGRFEGHAIPLEFLRDLAVLNDMIQEGAKAQFLKAHPDRKGCPKGFADDFSLVLSGVEQGSVIPVITLVFSMSGLLTNPNLVYYQEARDAIIAAINAVAENKSPADFLSQKTLSYFKNFGDRLRDGEAIEFLTNDSTAPARFTREVRRKLLLSLPEVQEVSEEVELRGRVELTNQGEKRFAIKLADGSDVPGPIVGDHYDNIIEATAGYRDGMNIFLQDVGTRDRQGKLLRIESIEHSSVLDPLDIHARLEEIRVIKDGWLDGEGHAPAPHGLDWLEAAVRNHYENKLPLPRIYPVPEGQVLFEWSINSKAASLEIDLSNKTGYWHVLDLTTKQDMDEALNLGEPAGWERLARRLTEAEGEQAE